MTFEQFLTAAQTPRYRTVMVNGCEVRTADYWAHTVLPNSDEIGCFLITAHGRTRRMRSHFNGKMVTEATARAAFEAGE